MPKRLAIYHPSGQLELKADPFGKDIANLELVRALAHYGGYEHLHVLTNRQLLASDLEAILFKGHAGRGLPPAWSLTRKVPPGLGPWYAGSRDCRTSPGCADALLGIAPIA